MGRLHRGYKTRTQRERNQCENGGSFGACIEKKMKFYIKFGVFWGNLETGIEKHRGLWVRQAKKGGLLELQAGKRGVLESDKYRK